MAIDASIFIRAKNEAELIGQCIERVNSQAGNLRTEIIVLDSGSSDQTREIARSLGAKVYSIPSALFSYSATLNAGIELCAGEYFIPISAHAVPVNNLWLKNLLEACNTSSRVASYSRQIAWPEASPTEQSRLSLEFPEQQHFVNLQVLKEQQGDWKGFYRAIQFSNASSCIQRSILRKILFRNLPFSEDRAFALDCILAGFEICYVPSSLVYHSHYPVLTDFYRIARQATFAEQALRKLAEQAMHCSFGRSPFPYWKLLAIIPYACLSSMPALLSSLVASAERKTQLYREVACHLAEIGTSFGKYHGLREFDAAETTLTTAPADVRALMEQIHEL